MRHGTVLTQVYSIDQLFDAQRRGKHDAVKVITGWGFPWDTATRRSVARSQPLCIVRSVAGDPSYNQARQAFPSAKELIAEFAPWYAARNDIIFEVGNEPNAHAAAGDFIWAYRWHLDNSLKELRKAFPKAKFCAPGMSLALPYANWYEVCADVMIKYDYVALHAYAETSIEKDDAGQFGAAWRIGRERFGNQPWLLTEYGINSHIVSNHAKGVAYRAALAGMPNQVAAATYYHLCVASDVHPNYHIWPIGEDAIGA